MKKLLALTIMTAFTLGSITPVFSIEEMNSHPDTKVDVQKKQQPKKKKFFSKKQSQQEKNLSIKPEYVNMDFWASFDDPILEKYILMALKKNHDLKIASISTDEYYQNYKLQFSQELPQISVGFAPGLAKLPGSTSSHMGYALPGIATYEADIFLKNRDKTKAQKKLFEASVFDERAVYISVAAAVGTTYLNLVMLDKAIELQEEINIQRRQIFDLMELSNKEGLTSTADTLYAHKALLNGHVSLFEYRKQREKILHQLAVLIGESPENIQTLERISLDELVIKNNVPLEISSEVIENRPDYLRAAKMLEKAGLDVRVAKKEFLPSINLGALALFTGNIESLLTTKNMLWSLGGSALLPIFTGGQRIANLRLKKDQYERLLQTYLKTNLTSIQEVYDALTCVKHDYNKLSKTLEQQALEDRDYKYDKDKYNEGVISKLDLIQQKENLLSINQLVAQQKVEYLVDYIGLYKACGAKI